MTPIENEPIKQSYKMPFSEKALLVGASVTIAVAITAVAYQFVKSPISYVRDASDDVPIIMAGGSLHIGTSDNLTLEPDSSIAKRLNYSSLMHVFQIDVVRLVNNIEQTDSTPVAPNTNGSVVLNYCKNKNCNAGPADSDAVTLFWDASKHIWITSSFKLSRLLQHLHVHPRKKWILSSVVVNGGAAVDCGSESECTVVVHNCEDATGTKPCKPKN